MWQPTGVAANWRRGVSNFSDLRRNDQKWDAHHAGNDGATWVGAKRGQDGVPVVPPGCLSARVVEPNEGPELRFRDCSPDIRSLYVDLEREKRGSERTGV